MTSKTSSFNDSLADCQNLRRAVREAIASVPRGMVSLPSNYRDFFEDLTRGNPRNAKSFLDRWAFEVGPHYLRLGGDSIAATLPLRVAEYGLKAIRPDEVECLYVASNAEEDSNHELNRLQNELRYDSPIRVFDLVEYAAHKQIERTHNYAVTVNFHKQRLISERKKWA